jgi:hypothetical protein
MKVCGPFSRCTAWLSDAFTDEKTASISLAAWIDEKN